MKRGELWTVSGGGDYTGKPRPALIIQDDHFSDAASVTVCAFTSDSTKAPLFRIPIEPSEANGLKEPSNLMVDKVTTVSKGKLGKCIGRLDDSDIVRVNRALVVFLGLAGSAQR